MYKPKSFGNRRYKSTSNNKRQGYSGNRGGGRSSYSSRNSGNRWKTNNRRRFKENIAHSMYISNPEDANNAPKYIPESNFNDFGLHSILSRNISDRNYVNPTKVQDQAIPEILKGKDVLGIASTGSGKTGAFLIPLSDKVLRNPGDKVLIITPTRELASQINNEFRMFTRGTNLRMALVIGGANINGQIQKLRTRPQFVVATPGRLIDLEDRKVIDLRSFNNIVLDEVDQMLDMGFVDDIKMVINKLAPQRQSLFFSATMSPKEERIANTLLNAPVKVESYKQSPLKSIRQDIVKIKTVYHKIQVLHELLQKEEFNKVLVFSETKHGADDISDELRKRGIMVDALHGNKSQNKRTKILDKFRNDKIDVLVATDVAARGIDIPDISHVINYDEPANYNDYIHRIGRTGRIGKKGTALTFVISN
jgi:ATP-dependent RNA helicase RhlE